MPPNSTASSDSKPTAEIYCRIAALVKLPAVGYDYCASIRPYPAIASLPPTMDSKQGFTQDKDVRIETIRTVLNLYPFSIGIFREILQNSEDAKASKQVESVRHTFCLAYRTRHPQVFLLDCRTHPPAKLRGTVLEHTNGPALLAFNDATFRPEDWEGILTVFKSSKRRDASYVTF